MALSILGYRAKHFPELGLPIGPFWGIKKSELRNHDALTDLPVCLFYKDLDKRYPNSKFILTIRAKEDWLRSCGNYGRFVISPNPRRSVRRLRQEIYGTIKFDRARFLETYESYIGDVKSHFSGRKNDLLILDICGGDTWAPLCEFLNKPIPDMPFPHKNANIRLEHPETPTKH